MKVIGETQLVQQFNPLPMGPGVTSGLCMDGMNKPLATVDAVRRERVKL